MVIFEPSFSSTFFVRLDRFYLVRLLPLEE